MKTLIFKGIPVRLGISTIIHQGKIACTRYASIDFIEEDGRRLLIENVVVPNDVERLLNLDKACELYLLKKGSVKIAFGIKLNNGQMAYGSMHGLYIKMANWVLICGILLTITLLFAVLGIPAILFAIGLYAYAARMNFLQRNAFYGADPRSDELMAGAESVRI